MKLPLHLSQTKNEQEHIDRRLKVFWTVTKANILLLSLVSRKQREFRRPHGDLVRSKNRTTLEVSGTPFVTEEEQVDSLSRHKT